MSKEDKIPTAWDLIEKAPNSGYSEREACIEWNDIENMMIEFAKLHVQKALERAADKAELDYWNGSCRECGSNVINEKSILNAYPLENIK